MNNIKCDSCSLEVDVDKDPEELDEIWCEECIDYNKPNWKNFSDNTKWNAVVCTKCYNKGGKLEIWLLHVKDKHISINLA